MYYYLDSLRHVVPKFGLGIFFVILSTQTSFPQRGESYSDYIGFYQKYISGARDGHCQMYPSCSYYGLEAFKNYSPFKAMAMTSDRVLRCSHDREFYKITLQNNQFKMIDLPVQNDSVEQEVLFKRRRVAYPVYQNQDSCMTGFVNRLMLDRNYREALLEINRVLYQGTTNCVELYLDFIRCKRSLNEIEDAIFKYENSFPANIKDNSAVKFEIGKCYFELRNYPKAIEYYNQALQHENDVHIDEVIALQALTYAEMNDFVNSKLFFGKVPETSPYFGNAQKAIAIIDSKNEQKYKSPIMAGALATIPGLGYLYTGHKSSAISSLVINGLLGYAVYSSIKTENYGMATLVGVFSMSFYLGNISGSVKSAKRYNDATNNNLIRKIESNIYY